MADAVRLVASGWWCVAGGVRPVVHAGIQPLEFDFDLNLVEIMFDDCVWLD